MVLTIGMTLMLVATAVVGIAYYALPSPGDVRLVASGLSVSPDRPFTTLREWISRRIAARRIKDEEMDSARLKWMLRRELETLMSAPHSEYPTAAEHAKALVARMRLMRALMEQRL